MSMQTSIQLLDRLSALFNQSLREDAARHGLLPIHIQALAYLSAANQYSDIPVAVAEYFGTTRGTVSQTLAVLVRKGLIQKEADPKHGKRIHLRLTDAGKNALTSSWAERLGNVLDSKNSDIKKSSNIEVALEALLIELQKQNSNQAFGVCHQCAHFQLNNNDSQCGLTGESLATEQTVKICREWQHPAGDHGAHE